MSLCNSCLSSPRCTDQEGQVSSRDSLFIVDTAEVKKYDYPKSRHVRKEQIP